MMIHGFKDAVQKNLKEAFEYAKKYVNSTEKMQLTFFALFKSTQQ